MAQSKQAKKIQIELEKKGSGKKLSSKDLKAIDDKNFLGTEILKNDKFFEVTKTKRVNGDKDVQLTATRNSITKEKIKIPLTRVHRDAPRHEV